MPAAEPDPIDLAARALRHRDRSRAQVAERLERAGIVDERRDEALDTLERVGYVDDRRFAATRAAALAARGLGDEAIRHDLAGAGLSQDAIDEAMSSLEPEPARADAVVRRDGRTAKTARQLARKGFAEETIETVIGPDIPAGSAGGV